MKLTSSAFSEGGKIPSVYTCEGKGINPPLDIADVPAEAKSLVLIMDDPDVPASVRADRMYDHWVVFNIPSETRHIKEHATPPGVQGRNTSGKNVYIGPCPPDREHRYFFKLYALNKLLSLKEGSSKKEVEEAMRGHILKETHLMGRYEKKHQN
jgi:Raf kinase inhibitor-like YbhB/YbcL family protein